MAHVNHGHSGSHSHSVSHSHSGSPDDQYAATPPGAGYEHTDASVFIVVKFLVWLAAAAVVIHVGLAFLFGLFAAQRVERAEPRFPLAATDEQRLPPEPRLQQFPREDILNYRITQRDALETYGWTDKQAGTVHIPIQDAMKLVLDRKMLPSRQQNADDPSAIPSDASGGRTAVKR
jgi:hypothetical protein